MTASIRRFLWLLLILLILPGQARSEVSLVRRWDGAAKGDGFGFFIKKLDDNGSGDSLLTPRQDGTPDILISRACNGSNCPGDEGSVSVYSGKDFSLIFRIDGTAWSYAVDAGDLNGDGISDLFVGEFMPTGRVRAFSGLDGSEIPALTVYGDYPGLHFGVSVSMIGDITGDGIPDLIAGDDEEAVLDVGGYAILSSGKDGSRIARIDNPELGNLQAGFGRSVSEAGDIDGDGIPDFSVGSPGAYPKGISHAGSAYLFSGRVDLGFPLLYRLDGENAGDRLGGGCGSLGSIGDLNGDGKQEVAVTALWASPEGRTNAGSVYLFDGGTGTPMTRPDGQGLIRFDGESAGDHLGGSPGYECGWIARVGDINGDDYPDFMTGAPRADISGIPDAGRVLVFSGYDASVLLRIDNPDPAYTPHYFGVYGTVVGEAGGKGDIQVVVGAGDPFSGTPETGAAWLFDLSPSGEAASASAVIYGGQSLGFTAKIMTSGNKTWMTNSPETTLREKLAAGVIRGMVYLVEDRGDPKLVTIWIYDPVTNTYKIAPPMSVPRSGAAVGVVGNFLYVAGGFDGIGPVATVEAYDPMANAWTTKAPMPTARSGAAAGVVGTLLYVIGGFDGKGSAVTVEAYDPAGDAWTAKASMPRIDPMTGVANGILYCVWAREGTNPLLDAYDPVSGVWARKAPLSTSRTDTLVTVEHGMLYVREGAIVGGSLEPVEAYDPVSDTWKSKNRGDL